LYFTIFRPQVNRHAFRLYGLGTPATRISRDNGVSLS
jgi:hypothetical protein